MSKFIISEEAARDQLNLFTEYYDIELEDIPEKQVEAYEASVNRIIKGIRKGKIEIKDDDGIKIIQTVGKEGADQTLVYGEISGRTKLAMAKKSETDGYGRIYALCGSLTGSGEGGILKLKGADLGLCECIGALFLNV